MKRIAVLLPASVLLVATRALAQDPAPAPKKEETPEVRVIGDKADSLQKIPGSGTLITHKEIERAQPQNAAEMLRRVPGFNVSEQQGGGLRLDLGVHGLDPGRARNVLILEDGIPMAINPYSEADMYTMPQIERMRGIEVVKGSGSVLFGPQTIGGVVNFLTLAPPSSEMSAVELDGGQRGFLKVLALHGDSVGSARYIVQAFHTKGDGFRDESFNTTDVMGKVAFETGANGEATVKLAFHDDATRSDDVGLTREMFKANREQGTLAPADHIDQQRYDASLTHEQRIGSRTVLKTLLYAYETKRIWNREDYDRANVPGVSYDHVAGDTAFPNGGIYFRSTNTILDRNYDVAAIEPKLQTRGETGDVGHTLDVGTRVLTETAHYRQLSGDTPSAQTGTLDYEFEHHTYAFAAYAQDRLKFRDWLLVTPGIRYEYADLQSTLLRQPGATGTTNVNVPSNGTAGGLIPGVGMTAGTPELHAFGGMFVGYAPPRITTPINPKGGAVGQLDSEKSINYEIGARFTKRKKFHAELSGFLLDFSAQNVQTGAVGGASSLALFNAGATRHYGVEGEARLDLGNLLSLGGTALELGERFTFARAVFAQGTYKGNILPYSPSAVLVTTLAAGHALGPGNIGGELGWFYQSEEFTDPNDTRAEDVTGRTGVIGARHVFDLSARYKHTRSGLTLKLSAKSFTNDIYVAERMPEGIHAGGFRQIILGLRWDQVSGPP